MSLITQGRAAAEKAGIVLDQREPPPIPAPPSRGEMVERVLQFVPVEVVGIYVALNGAVAPKTPVPQWVIYAGSVLLVPLFLYFGSTQVVANTWSASPGRRLVHLSWMGIAALTAWVLALPSNPFLFLFADATQWGTGGLIVLAALLPAMARKMKLA